MGKNKTKSKKESGDSKESDSKKHKSKPDCGCLPKKKKSKKDKDKNNEIHKADVQNSTIQDREVIEEVVIGKSVTGNYSVPQIEVSNKHSEEIPGILSTKESDEVFPLTSEIGSEMHDIVARRENTSDGTRPVSFIREKTRTAKNLFFNFDPSKEDPDFENKRLKASQNRKSPINKSPHLSDNNNDVDHKEPQNHSSLEETINGNDIFRKSTVEYSDINKVDEKSVIVTNGEIKTSDIPVWKPKGFKNPIGYCYLNSVIQVLGSCVNFKEGFLKTDSDTFSSETDDDSRFVKGIFDLLHSLKKGDDDIEDSLKIVQSYISESSTGDDVYKCFMNILSRISNVTKDSKYLSLNNDSIGTKAKMNFQKFQNRESSFVFDNFYGQLAFQVVCKECNQVCNESYQMMKSLALPVPTSDEEVTLEDCISLFLAGSDLDMDRNTDCNCKGGSNNLKLVTRITHSPLYLFIYLNRGSYFAYGEKNVTYVKCGSNIEIDTTSEERVSYKLISVIDHIGSNHGGHYYCKCSYETNKWWLLNDTQVKKLSSTDQIVTGDTIVFLFKKS